MQLTDVQIVLADWVEKNMLSVFPEYSWQRFLGAAAIPAVTHSLMKKLEADASLLTELGIYSKETGINLDKLQEYAEQGFASCPKVRIPFMGETFWINKDNGMNIIQQLKAFESGK